MRRFALRHALIACGYTLLAAGHAPVRSAPVPTFHTGTCDASAVVALNIPNVRLTGGTVAVEINTTSQEVNSNFVVGGAEPSLLALQAGPYFRVSLTGAELVLGADLLTVTADFQFEQETKPDNSKLVRFGIANASATNGSNGLTNGTGAFVILDVDAGSNVAAEKTIDCSGLHLMPGVIDDQVHFRDPGLTHKEDLQTASRACAVGGVTSFLEMPNTKPPAASTTHIYENAIRSFASESP